MKKAVFILGLLYCSMIPTSISAKNYTHKATRPAASDHTWCGYDYNFNIDDESGSLTGTNTFSLVYNTVPPQWYNDEYTLINPKYSFTGHETLTITVDPGEFNYTYTLTTAVVQWVWDTHLLKWVKYNDCPMNGTRTFRIRDGIVSGSFEFPIAVGATGARFIFGNSRDGLIPQNGKIGWKAYDFTDANPTVLNAEIVPEGNNVRINIEAYIKDVIKNPDIMRMTSDENGTSTQLRFPITGDKLNYVDIFDACGSLAGVNINDYAYILLPDLYYDKYVDPFAPVTTILPNGHQLETTLQPNGSYNEVESWEENGYSYVRKKIEGNEKPVIGKKTVNDTTLIHYIDKHLGIEEHGFYLSGRYYMTKLKNAKDRSDNDVTIDWSKLHSDGFYVIDDKSYGERYYCLPSEDAGTPTFEHLIKSGILGLEYGKFAFKSVDSDGNTTILITNKSLMTPQAEAELREERHPYLLNQFKEQNKEIPADYTPVQPFAITLKPDGSVKAMSLQPRNLTGREKLDYQDYDTMWYQFLSNARRTNALSEIASLINMELEIPDYDTDKIDAKVIGKRTSELLKKLTSLLNQKLNQKSTNVWPNGAKKAFLHGNRWKDFKKAQISRIVKNHTDITVYVTTINDKGREKTVTLQLQDNIPTDKYGTVWQKVANSIK